MNGTGRTYIVAGLNPNTTYYFAVKSKYENSAYSPISNVVSIATTAGTSVNNESNVNVSIPQNEVISGNTQSSSTETVPTQTIIANDNYGGNYSAGSLTIDTPVLITARPENGQVVIDWHNPGDPDFVRTILVRKLGSYPTSPTDGTTLYEGRGETYTDTSAQNGTTYYYALYSYNHGKTFSNPVEVSLAPSAVYSGGSGGGGSVSTGGSSGGQVSFNLSGATSSAAPMDHFTQVFQKGSKDIEVEHLQEILATDQEVNPKDIITGYFGPLTESTLKLFQAKHRLAQTGIVDAATQTELNTIAHSQTILDIPSDYAVIETDLKQGDQNEDVSDLQKFLVYEGSYPEANVSGYFGSLTKSAVMRFQDKHNISPVSGYVGPKTRHKMQQVVGL